MPIDPELAEKLDRIIRLLELQTFVPEDQVKGCSHRNKIDTSVMGQAAYSTFYCRDCKQHLRAEG